MRRRPLMLPAYLQSDRQQPSSDPAPTDPARVSKWQSQVTVCVRLDWLCPLLPLPHLILSGQQWALLSTPHKTEGWGPKTRGLTWGTWFKPRSPIPEPRGSTGYPRGFWTLPQVQGDWEELGKRQSLWTEVPPLPYPPILSSSAPTARMGQGWPAQRWCDWTEGAQLVRSPSSPSHDSCLSHLLMLPSQPELSGCHSRGPGGLWACNCPGSAWPHS